MTLSRKNYENFAVIINGSTCIQILHSEASRYIDKEYFLDVICKYLSKDNPKFDEKLFREWCK